MTAEPGKLVRMQVTSGFPFWEGSTWEWELATAARAETGTGVLFRHYGFAGGYAEIDLAHTAQTWALILQRLGGYLAETASPSDTGPATVQTEIDIDQPRSAVASYASDPDNATRWCQNIKSVEWEHRGRSRSAPGSHSSPTSSAAALRTPTKSKSWSLASGSFRPPWKGRFRWRPPTPGMTALLAVPG